MNTWKCAPCFSAVADAMARASLLLLMQLLLIVGSSSVGARMHPPGDGTARLQVRAAGKELCTFPAQLWRTQSDHMVKTWKAEAQYQGDTGEFQSQWVREVSAHQMVVYREQSEMCDEYSGDDVCYSRVLQYKRVCVRRLDPVDPAGIGSHTYIYNQTGGVYPLYGCIRFQIRSTNVVQLWESKLQDEVTDNICQESNLIRNEWPWYAGDENLEWKPCPIVGGYDLSIYRYRSKSKRRVCHDIWRPSRLESDCLMADGLHFLFPHKVCNVFKTRQREYEMQCLGSWVEDSTRFILARNHQQNVPYVMRLPSNYSDQANFSAELYFSAVAPLYRVRPAADILHVQLTMTPSDPRVCYDDDVKYCRTVVRDNYCTQSGLAQFGNHCKKSCGLCNLAPTEHAECDFPPEYHGEWLLFENNRREEVTITKGRIHFSGLGEFVCKGKHWEMKYYKLMSSFTNGCRPRYSCIHFAYKADVQVLQYRLSASSRMEISFDECRFHDDSPPIGSMIRSDVMKSLLPVSRTSVDQCGLGSRVTVNAMFEDGRSCTAYLSDWDAFSCKTSTTITLTFHRCRGDKQAVNQEYQCEAYVKLMNDFRLLITRQHHHTTTKYACWLIRTDPPSSMGQPWKSAYILRRAQCGSPGDIDAMIYKPAEITFQIYSNSIAKQCVQVERNVSLSPSTYHYTITDPRASHHTGNNTSSRNRHNNKQPQQPLSPPRNNNNHNNKSPRVKEHHLSGYTSRMNPRFVGSGSASRAAVLSVVLVLLCASVSGVLDV